MRGSKSKTEIISDEFDSRQLSQIVKQLVLLTKNQQIQIRELTEKVDRYESISGE